MILPSIPRSAVAGVRWPAMPGAVDATVLAVAQQLDESQWWPPEELEAMQFRQLERLLAHAYAHAPAYRERLQPLERVRKGALTMQEWRRLPVLGRSDVQDAADALFSTAPPGEHGDAFEVRSSGSTGRPVRVLGTVVTELMFRAVNLRDHLWHRRDFRRTVAAIRLPIRGEKRFDRPVPWVPGYGSGPMHRFDIGRPADEQLAWLQEIDPDYLLTYPSNLAGLLRAARERGVRLEKLGMVLTMSELLDPEIRAECEAEWQVRVTDSYSAQEVGMIALQCPEAPVYHVQGETALTEVLRDDGTPCAPGEIGRVVVTPLHNFASPLIRYEIGDYAEVGERCACGRGLPVLTRILGRVRNLLRLPDGGGVWPSFGSRGMAAIAPVRQHQIVQTSPTRLEARLVVARPLEAGEEDALRRHLAHKLPCPFDVDFVYVDEIPRSAGGKFEDFVCEVAL